MANPHHGITAQELTQGILPMQNANISVIGLIATSTDADATMYPADTPVLLTGITKDNIDKAGTQGTLKTSLQTIRDITNPTVVVMRVSNADNVDVLDELLACQSRLGVIPKILGAPEIDTPAVVRKLVSIAKRRRAFVYASPRKDDGTLITDKTEIAAYRDTFGDRELHLIENQWGEAAGKVAAGKRVVYASRPYPTLVEKEDAYQPTVKPLDITLQDILKRGYGEDAYQPTVKPLDITMRDIVLSKQVDDKDAYQPTIKPLDITLKSIVSKANIDGDAYQPTVKPLDITLKRVVVSNSVDGEAYQSTVKPLDITLKTV